MGHIYERERAVLCGAVIEVFRVYSLIYFNNDKPGGNAQDILIGFALYIAQHQGRPLTSSDIADYLGLPRATVVRRLKSYERAGLLDVKTNGRRVEYTLRVANNPTAVARIGKLITRIRATLDELSKMDNTDMETSLPQT